MSRSDTVQNDMKRRSGRRPTILVAIAILLAASMAAPIEGDTLGFDTLFGSTENKIDGIQVATLVTLPVDGIATEMTAYINGGPADVQIRYAIYADHAGEPGALVVQSAIAPKGAGGSWVTIDLPDTPLAAGDYWLALSTGYNNGTKYYYSNSAGQTRHCGHDAIADGFNDPWGASTQSYARQVSIYVTYASSGPTGLYVDDTAALGFDVSTSSSDTEGSGLHWADFDLDGDLDAIITGDSAKYMTNLNAGTGFVASTFDDGFLGRQGCLLDIDNDGDVDFWHRTNSLFENNSSGGFTDAGDLGFDETIGLTNEGVAAADVDGDGWCDVLTCSTLGNYIGANDRSVPPILVGTADVGLGLNDAGDSGDGEFVSSGDINNDGFVDFFYHYGPGKLFVSNGDGTYTRNAGGISIVTGDAARTGSAWGDYDNDGDLDLFVPRFSPGGAGWLWRNNGSGVFSDVASTAGLDDTSGQRSAAWGDYDNDGDLDLYIVTHSGAANVLYRNQGDGTFLAVNENAAAAGDGHDATFVDYDNDGDLDLAVTQGGATDVLLRNTLDDANYLKVRVLGRGAWATNAAGIGVRVELFDDTGTTLLGRRDVGTARGYGSTEPLWLHFGGVDPNADYVLRVHFRSGVVETLVRPALVSSVIGSVTIDRMITITETRTGLQPRSWTETDPNAP